MKKWMVYLQGGRSSRLLSDDGFLAFEPAVWWFMYPLMKRPDCYSPHRTFRPPPQQLLHQAPLSPKQDVKQGMTLRRRHR